MAKSVKLKDEHYIDSTGIAHEQRKLSDILNEINYNLITNGDAVKTGRKIDGKLEYIKRFGFTGLNATPQTYSRKLGFELSDAIIVGFEGSSKSNSNNWFYFTDTGATSTAWGLYFALYDTDNTIRITTMNQNMSEAYINVRYLL